MPDITHRLTIHAAPERVYQALTTTEGIRNGWTRDADLDSRVGGMGGFRFYEMQFESERAPDPRRRVALW